MRHSWLDKAESVANTKSQIQIVDTHESLKTPVNIGIPASESQFNRTLLCSHKKQPNPDTSFAAQLSLDLEQDQNQ
jgi:hypothetical protein